MLIASGSASANAVIDAHAALPHTWNPLGGAFACALDVTARIDAANSAAAGIRLISAPPARSEEYTRPAAEVPSRIRHIHVCNPSLRCSHGRSPRGDRSA